MNHKCPKCGIDEVCILTYLGARKFGPERAYKCFKCGMLSFVTEEVGKDADKQAFITRNPSKTIKPELFT